MSIGQRWIRKFAAAVTVHDGPQGVQMSAAAPRMLVSFLAAATVLALAPAAMAAGTVTVEIVGQGSVTAPGINCTHTGGDCSESYANVDVQECTDHVPPVCGTTSESPLVAFTAGPDSNGFAHAGWTFCDDPSGRTCRVTVDGDRTIRATFRDGLTPSAALTPIAGAKRGTITLGASASDNSGVVNRVEFLVRGSLVGTDTTAPYAVAFDTASVPDGAAAIRAIAYDGEANSKTTADAPITIDNTAPALSVTGGPAGETFGPGTTQTWSFAGADGGSGVAGTDCSVVPVGAAPSFAGCSGGPGSHAVAGLPGGAYVFTVRTRDVAGNATSAERAFAIDALAPETEVTSGPADGASSTETAAAFGFSSSEPGSFECRVYPAALTPPAFGACASDTGHSASGFSPGTYTFEVRSRDGVGNVDASPAKRTFTVLERVVPKPPAFDPRVTYASITPGRWTRFTALGITRLPKGAAVAATCKGGGCAFKRRAVPNSGARVNALKALKRLRLRSGTVLVLRITGAQGQLKVVTWKMRKARLPAVTYRCAAPGQNLRAC